MKTLKEHRKDQYLSVRELAQRAGVAHQTVLRIEHGKGSVQGRTVRKLAEALGLEPAQVKEFASEGDETEEGG